MQRHFSQFVVALLMCAGLVPSLSASTIVRFHFTANDQPFSGLDGTSASTVDVRLFDRIAPISVANFLHYMQTDRYSGSIIHRSIQDAGGVDTAGQRIHGGKFFYDTTCTDPVDQGCNPLLPIETFDPIQNEFGLSNLRGTLAFAKEDLPPGVPPDNNSINSATSEFLFNVGNNSTAFDTQNGGHTVFGRVLRDGMGVIDAINMLPTFALAPSNDLNQVPVLNVPESLRRNLVFVSQIEVLAVKPGDYNFDGQVNRQDYLVWHAQFDSATRVEADGNGDGRVNAADYTLWKDNASSPSSVDPNNLNAVTSLEMRSTPEPNGLLLGVLAGLTMLATRRRRNLASCQAQKKRASNESKTL